MMWSESVFETLEVFRRPHILMYGDRISVERANHIIVRTDRFWLHQNAKALFNQQVFAVCGLSSGHEPYANNDAKAFYEKVHRDFLALIKYVDLPHIRNQYMSSYAPYGWVNKHGDILFSDHVGSWIAPKVIYQECTRIAQNFPFLNFDLAIRDFTGDYTDYSDIAVVFIVNQGRVYIANPGQYKFLSRFGVEPRILNKHFNREDSYANFQRGFTISHLYTQQEIESILLDIIYEQS